MLDPKSGRPVTRFETIHEKLFHLFVVSQDLEYFSHEHPVLGADGWFRLKTTLPKPGTYRLLAISTLRRHAAASAPFPRRAGDLRHNRFAAPPSISAPKQGANLEVSLRLDPAVPLAGKKTMLFFRVTPAEGLEPYLGAWAHLLAVSHDLIDTIHTHPFAADGGAEMQFNLFLPRIAAYRIWLQVQRHGVVNTVAFTLETADLA